MDLRELFRHDRFARLTGVRLLEARAGYALARMRVSDDSKNGLGVAQGGAVFTLADLAFAAASNGAGQVAVAAQAGITFHKAGLGLLTAVAREVSRSRRLSACEVVVTDRKGDRVATFQGLAYVKQENIQDLSPPRARRRGAARRARK